MGFLSSVATVRLSRRGSVERSSSSPMAKGGEVEEVTVRPARAPCTTLEASCIETDVAVAEAEQEAGGAPP